MVILHNQDIFNCVRYNHVEELKQILENGENINIQDDYGVSPLYLAAWSNYKKIVVYLLERGADPNIQDEVGDTPLHIAAWGNSKKVITCLLENGANPNIQNKKGQTFLDRIEDNFLKKEMEEYVEILQTYSIKEPGD